MGKPEYSIVKVVVSFVDTGFSYDKPRRPVVVNLLVWRLKVLKHRLDAGHGLHRRGLRDDTPWWDVHIHVSRPGPLNTTTPSRRMTNPDDSKSTDHLSSSRLRQWVIDTQEYVQWNGQTRYKKVDISSPILEVWHPDNVSNRNISVWNSSETRSTRQISWVIRSSR